ncbi:hypothetical protein [Candidatus Photodesmus anomalopis]|uniref:Twin-arginine translocase TatA/TatE family subunit n=1 Tax=Candidatus Photodesmus katoptron Akat1 TaxID=1236703 RepID=S3E1F9_9GAMM|nr:hypothetical protein [Candidatus Photodesmus katoptron]EPE38016.1 hypothetical protein O1U_0479 [Candidatus Photodesmus katoptron Akat1]
MFDIGFWELGLISIISLLILGPERFLYAIKQIYKLFSELENTASLASRKLKIQNIPDKKDIIIKNKHHSNQKKP